MRLFRKLFLACLLLSVLALLLVGLVTWAAQTEGQNQRLEAYGRDLAGTLGDMEWTADQLLQLRQTINTLDRTDSARVWLFDRQGLIRLASESAPSAASPEPGPPARGPRIPPSLLAQVLEGEVVRGRAPELPGPTVIVPVFRNDQVQGAILLTPSPSSNRWNLAIRGSRLFFLGFAASAAILAVVSYVISRLLARPVVAVSKAVQAVAKGDYSARVDWEARDELGDLARSFNEMATELQRLEKARRDLLANVSHELKGPLARIAGYLEAIHDDVGGPSARANHLQIARRETARLSRLVNDLLDISRMEAGRFPLHAIPCDLAPYLVRAAELFRPPAEAAGIAFLVRVPPALPVVNADPERVEQALANLVENALAHTPLGGSVTVEAAAEPDAVQVTVTDTGTGIPADELDRIWERFYKVDRARTPDGNGSGLGLAIVRQLVELQGGRVLVRSQLNQGACFGFRLPLARPR